MIFLQFYVPYLSCGGGNAYDDCGALSSSPTWMAVQIDLRSHSRFSPFLFYLLFSHVFLRSFSRRGLLALALAFQLFVQFSFGQSHKADIVIYGATSSGVTAAIEASRSGNQVILIEPTNRVGGLTTGGLGQTDIGNKQVIGGVALEFYQNIKKYYENPNSWIWQKKSENLDPEATCGGISYLTGDGVFKSYGHIFLKIPLLF